MVKHALASIEASPVRVAQYLRMSTERQEYSPVNQAAAIEAYAAEHGMTLVRTYCDEGRSGLRLEGRAALKKLIHDIQQGHPGFEAVLVLDVTRWGRFQNADESAYYEFLCLRHGVRLLYVAESFESDGTPLSAVLKGLKRSMAAEYSRELSQKVYIGQCRVAKAGFHMGGPPGFGLRRMRVDAKGSQKGVLEAGEHKALNTDHVKVVLGPAAEVRLVRWMFRQSAAGVESDAITRKLNARRLLNANGRPWSLTGVRDMLNDPRYIGTSIFARTTQAIGRVRGALTPEREVRVEGAFAALVTPELFHRAKAVRDARNRKPTDDEMLDGMRALWKLDGAITSRRLNTFAGTPTVQAYMRRFGSLRAAYRLIGYEQGRDLSYGDLRELLRPWRTSLIHFLIDQLTEDGSVVERDGWVLRVDGTWTVGVRLLQPGRYHGNIRWEVRPWRHSVDVLVAARMPWDGAGPLDYLILPRAQSHDWPAWVTHRHSAAARFFTYPSLAIVRDLARVSCDGVSHVQA
jgi:DNA invertase Pin-like site-specific DNA recombinase